MTRWKSDRQTFFTPQPPTGGILPVHIYQCTTPCSISNPNSHYIKISPRMPVRAKCMPKWHVCLRHLNFVCHMRNIASSACILHRQSCLGTLGQIVYRLLVSYKTIIFFDIFIFTFHIFKKMILGRLWSEKKHISVNFTYILNRVGNNPFQYW